MNKRLFTGCAVVGHGVGPVNIPFQTEGERDHPSAGLLRIFMTAYSATALAYWQGSQGSPRQVRTLMTHQVSQLEGCRLHPDVGNETDVIKKWKPCSGK